MTLLAKLLKALNSEAAPWQIALAIALGLIIGLTPLWRLHNLVILFVVLFLRVNLASFLVSWGFFSALAYLLDPLMQSTGLWLLQMPDMQASWTALYNTSFGLLSQFNHSLTLGSLTIAIALSVPIYFASKVLVVKYRKELMAWVNKFKVVQSLKASNLFKIYQGLEG